MPATYSKPKLIFEVELSADKKKLLFNETTGLYNAVSNVNGWDAPGGATIAATTVANIKIKRADGTIYTVDASANFPTTDSTVTQSIASSQIGYSAGSTINDELLVITYEVGDGILDPEDYVKPVSIYILLTGDTQCCLETKFAALDPTCCDCTADSARNLMLGWAMMKAACYAGSLGRADKAADLLECANDLCDLEDCNC